MRKPLQVKFISNKDTELLNLIGIGWRISKKFYKESSYYVLPYIIPNNPRAIFFPKMSFYSNQKFWRLGPYYGDEIVVDRKKSYNTLLKQFQYDPINYTNQQKAITSIFTRSFQICSDIFPSFWTTTSTIIVMPTRYGSIASEYSSQRKPPKICKFYMRTDAKPENLFYIMLLEQINRLPSYKEYSWSERMAVCEHFFKYSKIAALFPDYKKILPLLKNDIDQQLLAESEKYQQNFGVNPQNIFTIKENTILAFNTPIMFTQQEKDVMIKLIEKSPMIASLDDIANAMWGSNATDKFSLYAINQCISMIRKKLKQNNLSPNLIETFRGQGYRVVS